MTHIQEFIKNDLRLRLNKDDSLVVYDPDRRFRELCLELADDKTLVIDASESSLESRLSALSALRTAGTSEKQTRIVVYVPERKPIGEKQKQLDPFSFYAECGAVFPADDADEFMNICLRARPDYDTPIRQMFATNPSPSFAAIDAIGAGIDWPQLRAALRVDSVSDILIASLAPTSDQITAFKNQELWSQEARTFLKSTLGMEVKTRIKSFNPLSEEVWRFLLFSEFYFDLPGPLPESLDLVPRAATEAKFFVESVCDRLRSDIRTRPTYIERAEIVEKDLNLPTVCRDIEDLGQRDTFPFEERTFLRRAIEGIVNDNADLTRQMLSRQPTSVWLGKGESQSQWTIVRAALSLIEACDDFERQLPERARSQEALLEFYTESLREADRLQREFEQSHGDFIDEYGLLGEVVTRARARYRRLAEKVQTIFVKHLESTGWPPAGRLANAEVYERFVGDHLKDSGRKIAYFMVDALRYELGVALQKLISEDGLVTLHAAYAQLPTITKVGMASLLPGAKDGLSLHSEQDVLVPKLAGTSVANVTQRLDVFRKQLGDRFGEMLLKDFARKKVKLPSTVDLLVLRSTEIDSQLESNPETALGTILQTLTLIRVALSKLRDLGFQEAVIATDHGFFLNAQAEAGDVSIKPQGRWPINAHDRLLLGDGAPDVHNFVLPADKLGIRGSFAQGAGPRSMAPYRAGHLYFHGGVSLTEAVVPVLVVRLGAATKHEKQHYKVELSYRGGTKKITTRLPVIDVAVFTEGLFPEADIEIMLEAQDEKGNVVGEPRPGGNVNPATHTLTLIPGQRKQIALQMNVDFEGKFKVNALNPTTLSVYNTISLETDYAV